jgi:5-methylcytosine-specific restriction endonuclease McrA
MLNKRSIKISRSAWIELVKEAWLRDGCSCQLCGSYLWTWELSAAHHIIPKGRLRLDILENILTIDKECHMELHAGNLETRIDDLINSHGLRHYLK